MVAWSPRRWAGGPAAPAAVVEVFDLTKVIPTNILKGAFVVSLECVYVCDVCVMWVYVCGCMCVVCV